jgi:hypothetical protein
MCLKIKRTGTNSGLRRRRKEFRILNNKTLHDLYRSPSTVTIVKSGRIRWAGQVARTGDTRNAHRILVGEPLGKRSIED